MSVPTYPAYRDSGVDWIGALPSTWHLSRAKALFEIVNGATPKSDVADYWDGDIPWVTPADLSGRASWRLDDSARTITPLGLASCGTTVVPPESIILSTRAPIGSLGLAGVALCTNQGCKALVPKPGSLTPFFAYVLIACQLQLNVHGKGTTFLELSSDALGAFPLPFPSPTEQSAIAAFLDRETGKIDALVAEQERLIALLKEKRQAVISQAVTKGLDPNAPLKDSGVEWLGEVPAHWDIRKISQLFRAAKGKNGQMLTKEFCADNEGLYPVYSGQTEDDGVMGTWCQFEFDFSENGVIFSTTVGAKSMYLKQIYGRFSLSQNCMIIFPTDNSCITRFFFYHFQPLFQWERSMIPDHMQPSFRMEDLYSFSVGIPPIAEQCEISEFLDKSTKKIDILISEATNAITLLRERRAALISAAVTGKIDVRGLVSPAEAQAA